MHVLIITFSLKDYKHGKQTLIYSQRLIITKLSYFSKEEDETSEAMKQAAREALAGNKSDCEKMKAIARAYATKRECSVQEAVYLVMPELLLRKMFPAVIFLNSNMLEKRYKIFKKKDKIDELPDDSTDIFQRNMLDR